MTGDTSIRRVTALTWILAVVGTVATFFGWGSFPALGFLFGATASAMNFRWLKHLVDGLGETAPPRRKVVLFVLFRYALVAIAGFALVKYSKDSLFAASAGLLVPVAAILIELIYAIIYARA
ncbi:MAG: hypothetical protein FJW40_03590 [Acidobacteria bacterium]|nr:hypothetical protein [Acidobacteriota bacterium]